MPSYIDNPAGMGFGNSIYIKESVFENDTTGDLLGHEAVHTLQTAAYGGLEGMLEAYGSNMKGLETAAYEFGGYYGPYSELTQRWEAELKPVFRVNSIRR